MIREIHQERKTQGGEARTQLQSKFTSGKKKTTQSLERQRADSGRERQHIRQRTETARHRQTVYMLVGN